MNEYRSSKRSERENLPAVMELDEERAVRFLIEHLRSANVQRKGKSTLAAPDAEFESSDEFWKVILESYRPKIRWVKFVNFQIIDWFPRTPGLYHTDEAAYSRERAYGHIVHEDGITFYDPRGKAHMMDGGLGAIRFKPVIIEDNETWLCTATSDEYCHTGVPLAIPDYLFQQIDLKSKYEIVGQIRFLPEFLEGYFYHSERISQIYVFVDRVTRMRGSGRDSQPTVITPMVFFKGKILEQQSSRPNVTYVSCEADSVSELDRATDWVAWYAAKYGGEVITNFDQQRPTFQNAPFSLQNVMDGKLNEARLQEFHIHNAKIVCDTIQRINAETIKTPRVKATFNKEVTIVQKEQPRNPWISGSFYLAAVVIIATLFLVIAQTVHALALPVVIVGALLTVSIIGAFQLRQDRSLSEKSFLKLMLLVFQQLPFLRRGTNKVKEK